MPLDFFLSRYFRTHKAVGSKDRKWISETIYAMIRWRGTLDSQVSAPATWEKRLEAHLNPTPNPSAPEHIRLSFPKWLYTRLHKAYPETVEEICLALNQPAPTTLRANALKTTREELLEKLPGAPTNYAPHGITLKRKMNLFASPIFKQGHFEMQDEGSQLIAEHVLAKPGDHVLDFCAGSGGKTLAIAPALQGKGQLYLHDIRPQALAQAKKRLRRAGIQNAQIGLPKKGTMDWVLVDAPCSGTGTLRRNPDMKWRLSPEAIADLVQTQREIFQQALTYLKPGGHIVYATCSILPEENGEQIAHFGLPPASEPFQSLPTPGGMDGFFAQTIKY